MKEKEWFKFSSAFMVGAKSFFWSSEFEVDNGKEKKYYSEKLSSLPRDKIKFLFRQKVEVIKKDFPEKEKSFLSTLKPINTHPFFEEKNLSMTGIKAFLHKDRLVFKKKGGGLFFLNKDCSHYSISPQGSFLSLAGDTERVYITQTPEDLWTCHNLTGQESYLATTKEELVLLAGELSEKFYDKNVIVLGINPNAESLAKSNKAPIDLIQDFKRMFDEYLNVVAIFPPLISDVKTDFSFYHYSFRNPEGAEKKITKIDESPKMQILGADGKKIWVFSRYLEKPLEVFSNTKMAELELICPRDFWFKKFGSTSEKKIVNTLFSLSRGKHYKEHLMRYAGVWKEEDGLVINTGNGLTRPLKSKKNMYVFNGEFPEPTEEPIDKVSFLRLKADVIDSISFVNKKEGYAIFAWAILALFAKVIPSRFSLNLYGDSFGGKSFTLENIIIPLQMKFQYIIREYIPGCTYAGFKDDLREGASVFHFEEAEGKSYDPDIQRLLRSSTYKKKEVKQMAQSGGASKKTPVSFMSLSVFNLTPDGATVADKNRTYPINYSSNRLNNDKQNTVSMALLTLDLESLGYQCFSHLYYHWEDFLKYREEAFKSPFLFGSLLNTHKRGIFSQIYSFYKVTGLIEGKELEAYCGFLKDKENVESFGDFNLNMLDAIGRISFYDNEMFKRKTLISSIQEVKEVFDDGHYLWVKWLKHLYRTYKVKIITHKKEVCIFILRQDQFIVESLKKMGYTTMQAESYPSVLESEFDSCSCRITIMRTQRRGLAIPIHKFCNYETTLKWQSLSEKNKLREIYS